MQGIVDWFKRWWAVIALSILIIVYTLFRGKQDKIDELANKLTLLELEKKLGKIEAEAKKNEEVFKIRADEYADLKRQHADITERLRLGSE